jgi:hypothetical protein
MTINYYEELESFKTGKKEAQKFCIRVELKTGEIVNSSYMPITVLSSIVAAVETADAAHTAFTVWNREFGKLTLIPHGNISNVSFNLL